MCISYGPYSLMILPHPSSSVSHLFLVIRRSSPTSWKRGPFLPRSQVGELAPVLIITPQHQPMCPSGQPLYYLSHLFALIYVLLSASSLAFWHFLHDSQIPWMPSWGGWSWWMWILGGRGIPIPCPLVSRSGSGPSCRQLQEQRVSTSLRANTGETLACGGVGWGCKVTSWPHSAHGWQAGKKRTEDTKAAVELAQDLGECHKETLEPSTAVHVSSGKW